MLRGGVDDDEDDDMLSNNEATVHSVFAKE